MHFYGDLSVNCPGYRKVEGLVRVKSISRPVAVIVCSNLFSLLTKWSVAWIKKNPNNLAFEAFKLTSYQRVTFAIKI